MHRKLSAFLRLELKRSTRALYYMQRKNVVLESDIDQKLCTTDEEIEALNTLEKAKLTLKESKLVKGVFYRSEDDHRDLMQLPQRNLNIEHQDDRTRMNNSDIIQAQDDPQMQFDASSDRLNLR